MTELKETTPVVPAPRESRRTLFGTLVAALSALVGIIYVLNPTFGLIELIPDNAPIIGNLDEAGATVMVVAALRYLFKGPQPKNEEKDPGQG